jgi:hypothetical protein
VATDQLQNRRAILARLADQAVVAAAALVAGYDEPRSLLLAVDNELKPGNSQALRGNWREALEVWRRTEIPPGATEKEAARKYNLGVAHEALAAAAIRGEDFAGAKAHLDEAEACYTQALSLDREEKYFRDTLERLQNDRAILQKEQEHKSVERGGGGALPPLIGTEPPATITDNLPLEGWPEGEKESVHDFRAYVRTRLAAQKADPSEELRQKLLTSAADYGVAADAALQVVDSEGERLLVLKQNVEKYAEDFQDVSADGTISAEEREVLRKRQKTLHLSDAQVKEVEARFPMK